MTVIRRPQFSDSATQWLDFMGKRCCLEVSGVPQGFGLAFFEFHHTTAEVCFAWRRSESGIELSETDESKRYCRFSDDWQQTLWQSHGIRQLLRRLVFQAVQPAWPARRPVRCLQAGNRV